jgi:MFS family permease
MVLLDWMNFGMTILVFPTLLKVQVFNNNTTTTAYWNGLISGIQPLLMFIFGPIWGTMSDGFGRKQFLIMGCMAATLYYSLNLVAFVHWLPGNPLYWVFG